MPHPPTTRRATRLGDIAWLTPDRAALYALGGALVWIALIGKAVWLFTGAHNHTGDVFGEDFVSFWAASRLVLAGHPADVYLPVMHRLAELPLLTRTYEAFYYPPAYLLLCAPLALLPFFAALTMFQVLTGVALLATLHGILRRRWAIVAALAFPAVPLNVIPGQNAFLTASIIGSGLILLDRRPRLAGALLGLMVIKPQLALAIPVALLMSRRWHALSCAAASAIGLLGLSWLVFGSACWANFLAHMHDATATMELGYVGFAKMDSAFALARLAGLNIAAAYAAQALSAGIAVAALVWAQHRSPTPALERSIICLASLLMTPFVLHYDMVMLALPMAWMLREWIDTGFPPWSKPVLLAVFCVPAVYLWKPVPFGLPLTLLFGGYLVWLLRARASAPIPVAAADRLEVLAESG